MPTKKSSSLRTPSTVPALTDTVSSGPVRELQVQPTYKAGLYAELQKFGSKERDRQLSLWPTEPDEIEVTVSGLDLTVSEDKALSAIQILLSQTGYQGNRAGVLVVSEAFRFKGILPRLEVTHSQYFEAYGLKKVGGRYKGHQVQEALDALRSLATISRFIYYERKRWTGSGKNRRQLSDIIRAKTPLIKLTEIMACEGLEQEEAKRFKAGHDIPEKTRARGFEIEVSPLLVDGIDNFYIVKPTKLHKEIQELYGRKRYSRSVSLFIQWLLTKNSSTVKISKEKLAERLRMDWYIENRRRSELEAKLQEAFRVAKDLGYLLEYSEEATGRMVFQLNPKRCFRVNSKGVEEEA